MLLIGLTAYLDNADDVDCDVLDMLSLPPMNLPPPWTMMICFGKDFNATKAAAATDVDDEKQFFSTANREKESSIKLNEVDEDSIVTINNYGLDRARSIR